MRIVFQSVAVLVLLTVASRFSLAEGADSARPNILLILCDDLGYGDVKCLNPAGKIATPHMDRLAREGLLFTDAHSSSAVCSPTRYGLMTGRYNWRTKLQSGVLGGLSPRLIEPGRMTIASLLKQHGYHTACVGKWHLGMDWVKKPGKEVAELNIESREQVFNVDYSQPIANGPTSVGFDEYFGISASLDMVPYAYIENDRVTALPTADRAFAMMSGREGAQTRLGPAAPDFDAANVLPDLTKRAVEIIGQRAADAKRHKPFFLYLPFASPHTPILPTKEWLGKSGLNPYADFVMQQDAAIGELLDALDRHQLADNTLVIFTSDNGCSPQAKFDELLAKGHNPSHLFRGHKADIFEGGHRVPFLVRWPGKIQPGSTTDQLTCLTDVIATIAEILGAKLPDNAAEDSISFLPTLLGQAGKPGRTTLVSHSINGSFAIRDGNWKLCLCRGSGGWSAPRPGQGDANLPEVQLFDLKTDIGERANLQAQHPDIVARLTKLLEQQIADGRSTPGAPQKNAVAVKIRK
jgi:arylsulfatase A-like enzyme